MSYLSEVVLTLLTTTPHFIVGQIDVIRARLVVVVKVFRDYLVIR